MTTRLRIAPSLLVSSLVFGGLALGLVFGRRAAAQYGGGPGAPGGGMPAAPMGQEPKEEGPAEQAPEDEGHPIDLEPLPGYAEQSKKKMQIFEIDGYLRLRGDYMHNFFLGQGYTSMVSTPPVGVTGVLPSPGLPPFPVPLGCPVPAAAGTPGSAAHDCGTKGMGGANLRLRLEPTLNVTDQVRVHAQIDVLDNTILGSTPDSLIGINRNNLTPPGVAPTPLLYTTEDPPEIGQNGYVSSIRAKRAWGEVDGEFGSLRFGRMPWSWGRGIAYNDGGCSDCDQGTTVDRLMALTQLYGHQLMASWDFGSQGLTSQQLSIGRDDPGGYPIDLSQDDDVVQFMAAITKIDNPVQLRERVDRGDLVVNYGLQLVYRSEQNDVAPNANNSVSVTSMQIPNNVTGIAPTPTQTAMLNTQNPINGHIVTPDLWFKLYFKALTIECEGTAVLGQVDRAGPLAVNPNVGLTLREFGWVVASEVRLYRDAFFIGFETGGATGDQAEDRNQYLNYRWKFVQQPVGDTAINDFKFSPEYHVDEILFRQILGTVTNAIYFKPKVSYWFDLQQNRQIGINASVIYSLAQVPVSYPGNSINLGLEGDVGLNYRNTAEGFYAGITYAVLWPLGALDRPVEVWGQADAAPATAAQMLRTFFGIKF